MKFTNQPLFTNLNQIKNGELIFGLVDAEDDVERSILPVHQQEIIRTSAILAESFSN